jgi:CRP-like cAMP-binding protein
MFDARWKRVGREVALAAFGVTPDSYDPWVFDRLLELLEERHVRAGETLWVSGESVDWLYFMPQGRVRAEREGATPWTFEGRWLLGGFEGHMDRRATRTLISRRSWFELLEDSFELTRRSIAWSAAAVANLDERLLTAEPPPPHVPLARGNPAGPLSMIERLAFLMELPMMRGAGVQVVADIAGAAEEIIVEQGETLSTASTENDRFFVVVEGEIATMRRDVEAARRYGAAEVVGGAAAFVEGSRRSPARAARRTRLLAVPIEAWFDLMEEHFDLAHSTLAAFAAQRDAILERLAAEAGPEGIVLT